MPKNLFRHWVIPPYQKKNWNDLKSAKLLSFITGSNKTWPNQNYKIKTFKFGSDKTWPNLNNNGDNHVEHDKAINKVTTLCSVQIRRDQTLTITVIIIFD